MNIYGYLDGILSRFMDILILMVVLLVMGIWIEEYYEYLWIYEYSWILEAVL